MNEYPILRAMVAEGAAGEIQEVLREIDDLRKDVVCDEQRVADLMADVDRLSKELATAKAQMAALATTVMSDQTSIDTNDRLDAVRYRLLKQHPSWKYLRGEAMDAALDAVITAIGSKG